METHRLKYAIAEDVTNDLIGKFLNESHYDTLFDRTVMVLKPDGSPLAVLLKGALPHEVVLPYYQATHNKIKPTDNRPHSSGQKNTFKKLKKKGVGFEKRSKILVPVYSSVIGFMDRNPAFPYCRKTSFNEHYKSRYAACVPLIKMVDQLFKQHLPERYARQREVANQTTKEFLIEDTTFTTVTLNKNFRTAAHKDAGDLPDGFGCISMIRTGIFTGGHLIFPRYSVAFSLDSGDLLLFDPHEVHANSEIKPVTKQYERLTSVFYYRKNMIYCGSHQEELARASSGDRTVK